MKKEFGTLYPSMEEIKPDKDGTKHGTMFFRQSCGTAKGDGVEYELDTVIPSGAMVVTSKKTGRQFLVSWSEVIEYAVERGINGKMPIPNPRDSQPKRKPGKAMKKLRKFLDKKEREKNDQKHSRKR